jgi:hypothetical protein
MVQHFEHALPPFLGIFPASPASICLHQTRNSAEHGGEFGEAAYMLVSLLELSPDPMNRYERRPLAAGEAEIEYLNGEFRVLRPGAFVLCAVTGTEIKLEDLRYWNVDLQEPYASPRAKLQRLGIKPTE